MASTPERVMAARFVAARRAFEVKRRILPKCYRDARITISVSRHRSGCPLLAAEAIFHGIQALTSHIILLLVPNRPWPKRVHVDDVMAITHAYGCGVAINAPGAAVPIRTLQNLARNPNFGGEVMIVGLGCEKLQPELLLPEGMNADDEIMRMQDEGLTGFGEIVENIVQMADAPRR